MLPLENRIGVHHWKWTGPAGQSHLYGFYIEALPVEELELEKM